ACTTQSAVAGLLLSHQYHLSLVVALETANGACAAFTTPALRGVLPQLVTGDRCTGRTRSCRPRAAPLGWWDPPSPVWW
ncbi:MAG: hypothetical protein WCB57_15370, partial [Pseudonocardiaceae bacterium]